jgi:uroporphyrinogen decarboxylase
LAHIVARSPTTMAALSAAPALAARLSAVRGKTARKSSRDVARRAIQVDTSADAAQAGSADPLMLRAIRGEDVERPPIWMMRQAGRYMKIYQDLCKKHPTFRERSETVDLAVEISLQPWDAFKPDGVILFSDILTPLSGMNIPFDIVKGTGPIIMNPVRSMEDVKAITPLEPEESMPFVGESLGCCARRWATTPPCSGSWARRSRSRRTLWRAARRRTTR